MLGGYVLLSMAIVNNMVKAIKQKRCDSLGVFSFYLISLLFMTTRLVKHVGYAYNYQNHGEGGIVKVGYSTAQNSMVIATSLLCQFGLF